MINNRWQKATIGLLMWAIFALSALAVLVLQPVGILVYVATGNERIRDWVYRTGKAVDQLANAAWFHGHPKETVSSHAGRWLRAEGLGLALDAKTTSVPSWVLAVRWLTDLVDAGHVRRAIETQFLDEPL